MKKFKVGDYVLSTRTGKWEIVSSIKDKDAYAIVVVTDTEADTYTPNGLYGVNHLVPSIFTVDEALAMFPYLVPPKRTKKVKKGLVVFMNNHGIVETTSDTYTKREYEENFSGSFLGFIEIPNKVIAQLVDEEIE